jgi:hypothetical protein
MKKFQTATIQFSIKNQPRISTMFFATLFAFSALIFATTNIAGNITDLFTAQAAQNTITGEWTAELNRKNSGEIQMTFHRRSENGGFNMTSDSVSLGDLQGITAETISSSKADVNFNIVREAGTFACEGLFREGRGAGFWTFTSSPNFVSAMRSRGYDNLTEEDFLRAATNNLTIKFIEDLKSAGYAQLEFKQLSRASSHNIRLKFIREMQSAGYEGLSLEQLIRARNHGISGEYVKEVQAMGFDKQPLEKLIRLRNHEITQGFINGMRSAGFENLSIEQLIRLKNHAITPEFVNNVKAEGYSNISPETAIRLKNHAVDRDFIRRAKAKGFTDLTLEQLVRLRSQDIIK